MGGSALCVIPFCFATALLEYKFGVWEFKIEQTSQGPEFGALINSCSSISGASFSCSLNALREQIKAHFLQCHRQCEADILSFLLVHPLSQHHPAGLLPTAVAELWVICVSEAKGGIKLF